MCSETQSEAYGQQILGTNSVIPIAVSAFDESIDQWYVAYSRHNPNNTPERYVHELEMVANGKTLEQCLEETFGEAIYSKLTIIRQGYELGSVVGMQAVSQWWSPALPKYNGEMP